MRVLINKNNIESITGYVTSQRVSNIVWANVDTIVFHSCIEDEFHLILALNTIPATVKTLIYINDNIDSLLYSTFKGKGGFVYNDMSFLADKGSLDYLVANAGSIGVEVSSASTNLEEVSKFINKLTTSEPDEVNRLVSNQNWVDTLTTIVSDMSTTLAITDQTSEKFVAFVQTVSNHVGALEDQNKVTSDQIQALSLHLKSLTAKQMGQAVTGNTAFKFGTYDISGLVRNVMYIRCYGDVTYLTTFMLAYQAYLGHPKGKNVASKLLIARPQFSSYMRRYSSMPKLTSAGVQFTDISQSNFYITFEPNKKVLDAFFSAEVPLFIILDFMQSEVPIVRGHMVKSFGAFSSINAYLNLENKPAPQNAIFALDGINDARCIVLPRIENFHQMTDSEKKSAYMRNCKERYFSLDKTIQIVGG